MVVEINDERAVAASRDQPQQIGRGAIAVVRSFFERMVIERVVLQHPFVEHDRDWRAVSLASAKGVDASRRDAEHFPSSSGPPNEKRGAASVGQPVSNRCGALRA